MNQNNIIITTVKNNCKIRDIPAVNILNVAAGKFPPLFYGDLLKEKINFNIVNLDRMYLTHSSMNDLVSVQGNNTYTNQNFYINHEIFDFLERYQYKFDLITMYRYLEHVRKTDILYFIYVLSTAINVDGIIDVIVPDYEKLCRGVLEEDVCSKDFEKYDILHTFEILNEPEDPHASIWTEDRIRYFFELEERFSIITLEKDYYYDGRDIYIRFLAQRTK